MKTDFKRQFCAGTAANECPRLCARRTARLVRARLEARAAIGGERIEVNLVRCLPAEPRVRAVLVVPFDDRIKFSLEGLASVWNQQQAGQQGFQREDESLDHRDAAVFADRPVARRLDALAFAPLPKAFTVKLAASVANDVLWGG
jgi:hypothetical protein